ncbi:MAG: glycosyltransferase family 2 protein [Lachnospiraceae bacterium]
MRVDLIIPTYKPDDRFRELIKRIMEQSCIPDKIIIMNTEEKWFDTSAVDGNPRVEVHHIDKEEFDHGATRHKAASYSDADILCFMTQDAMPYDPYVIENLVKSFSDPQVGVAYGRQIADREKSPIEAFTREFNYPKQSRKKTKEDLPLLGIKTFFCSNVCSAYRRDRYEELGGFIRKTIFNEDMIMASRMIEAGYAVYYAADAAVWHWHDYTFMQQLQRNFDLAVSQQMYGGLFLKVKSEKEGAKLVFATLKHLIRSGQILQIPRLVSHTLAKVLGYKLGRKFERLPETWVRKLSMNPKFWNEYFV